MDNSRASDVSEKNKVREKVAREQKTLIQKFLKWMIWQRDLKYYNTVALTQNWTNFFHLQLFRLLMGIVLGATSMGFTFIFLKRALFIFSFYGLVMTTFSFWFLFIGSGMQVVEQKNLMRGTWNKSKGLSKLWRKGIFLYNQSIPIVITSNIMFWCNNVWHLRDDINLTVRLYLTKVNNDKYTWRDPVIFLAHVVPACAVLLDMSMNRIRIPWHHVIYNMLFLTLYLLGTYIYEIYSDYEAIFAHSLNWACKKDWSYRYYKTNRTMISQTITYKSCAYNYWLSSDDTECNPMYNYYCLEPDKEYEVTKEFDPWMNRNKFIASIYVLTLVSFFLSWLIHKLKAGVNTKGFNKKKWQRRIKKGWFQQQEALEAL